MELTNSLGCKMCKKPLELCKPINQTNTRRQGGPAGRNSTVKKQLEQCGALVPAKFEGTFRQQLLQGARAEELDPQPVAARCGHIYHRGCIRKLTADLNSSCVECPVCLKPIVLTQVWPIIIHSPEKDVKNGKTLATKVHRMNKKNNSLQDEHSDIRRLRAHKEAEYNEVCDAIQAVKSSIHLRNRELEQKLINLFGTSHLDEHFEENVRYEKECILKRVKDLTNRNSELLTRIEDRAKSHYTNDENNNSKDLKDTSSFDNNTTSSHLGQGDPPDEAFCERLAVPATPARILNKPTQVSRASRNVAFGDAPEMKMDSVQASTPPNEYLLEHVEELLESLSRNDLHRESDGDLKDPRRAQTLLSDSERAKNIQQRVPLASVTRSMQQLFLQEKLKYLQSQREASKISNASSSAESDEENEAPPEAVEEKKHKKDRRDSSSSHPPQPLKLHNFQNPSTTIGLPPLTNYPSFQAPPAYKNPELNMHHQAMRNDGGGGGTNNNCNSSDFSVAMKIINRQAEKTRNSPKVLTSKELRFIPSKPVAKEKKATMTTIQQPQVPSYKLAFPSAAEEQKTSQQQPQKTREVTRCILNLTNLKRQRWKPTLADDAVMKDNDGFKR